MTAPRTYDFPRPGVATDIAIFSIPKRGKGAGKLHVLLIKRGVDPEPGKWALPGGFLLEDDQDLDACALRELSEETEISAKYYLKHFRNFSDKDRDERWVVSAAYFGLMPWEKLSPRAGSDAAAIEWFQVPPDPKPPPDEAPKLPELAFDHSEILNEAIKALRADADIPEGIPLLLRLVPHEFTLTELQIVHHAVCGHGTRPEDLRRRKAHFRKTILNSGKVDEVPDKYKMGSNRPAQLYKMRENIDSQNTGEILITEREL